MLIERWAQHKIANNLHSILNYVAFKSKRIGKNSDENLRFIQNEGIEPASIVCIALNFLFVDAMRCDAKRSEAM